MLILIGLVLAIYIYQFATGCVEATKQGRKTIIGDNDYHWDRLAQGFGIFIIFALGSLHTMLHPTIHAWLYVLVIFLGAWFGADGFYNRVLWFLATYIKATLAGTLVELRTCLLADGIDRTKALPWWAWLHKWAWMDWARVAGSIIFCAAVIR